MRTYLFICPFCQQSADRAGAFFNEGQPFCSDACRTADFQSRNMVYLELTEPQADQNEQRLSGSQFDDLHVWPRAQED